MGLRFTFVGKKADESLDLGPRLLRELGPHIEDALVDRVGPSEVVREGLGRGLKVRVAPRGTEMRPEEKVQDEIGQVILDNLMDIALDNPGGPLITPNGALVQGGRVDGKRLGL